MSAYASDDRVVVFGGGHLGVYLPQDDRNERTPSGDVRPRTEGWFAAYVAGEPQGSFRSLDEAVESLIGPPRTTEVL
ncbi:hypothetical protein [Catenuloplanes indicus]|uniref:Uncharacterized protein n=1 Tax=Catenuloplanes indicus TaxID=137267 RepID=A0AAE3WAS6_9ACTN|nr:hypothetical protein [Catenuloplanes indicus]MDQ0363355.1 hypothetical protein [Catenuloplanes indicus]MDQ0371677.1 hypothetical protein [Catenuloplanes indicus]